MNSAHSLDPGLRVAIENSHSLEQAQGSCLYCSQPPLKTESLDRTFFFFFLTV